MKTIERLEQLLNEKDAEIERLEEEIGDANAKAEADHAWTRHVEYEKGKEPNPELPVPRLEVRWVERDEDADGYTVEARYSLVYRHLLGQVVFVPLGITRSTGALAERTRWKMIDLPFRDGAHFRNEIVQLGLRGFAIVGDEVQEFSPCSKCKRLQPAHRGEDVYGDRCMLPPLDDVA